jgi:membrane protease YdiL (CAAX protease family)
MEANLAASGEQCEPVRFPYANWGPWAAILGVLLALGTGIVLSVPVLIASHPSAGEDLSDGASALVQAATALGFLLVPFAIAAGRGATVREAAAQLGLRRFKPSALLWMLAAIGAYLLFAIAYTAIFGSPEQEDVAEAFGAVPVQVLLIVVAAPISEEVCFRGFLFGGLRERFPRLLAALITGLIFGGLHATTGLSAIPILAAFGLILALLYEKTGSIVPGILLHMLNNSVALLAQ